MFQNTRAIILAAGRSTRFKTEKSKLLYNVCGQPMIIFPLQILENLGIPITIVLGYQAEKIKAVVKEYNIKNVNFVIQEEQLGTGHAVLCTQKNWDKDNLLILNGDMPLLKKEIIEELITEHTKKENVISFLSAHVLNPKGYGRIIKENNKVFIIEEKDCTEDQRYNTLCNSGIYLIEKQFLEKNIKNLNNNNAAKEFYIIDFINIASNQNQKTSTIPIAYDNVRGVNTLEELWAAEQIKRSDLMRYWMEHGVQFELAQSTHLDVKVKIGAGSFVGTGAHLIGETIIGKNSIINAFSLIRNTTIGNNSQIHSHSVIEDSQIGDNVHVGPFARLRKNVVLGNNTNVGNFVEIKNSQIDENSTTKHLSYIGDAKVGKNVNIGAGTITCNYDGISKSQTTIEDNVFIGSNNTLIAPIKIEKNSYTAAGSTLTKDVPKDSLAIARSRQENKKDYAKNITNKKKVNEKDLDINFMGATKTDKVSEENL